jgi:hypothetical protein
VFFKVKTLFQLVESMEKEEPQTSFYRLSVLKLLMEVCKYFYPSTPEEKKQLNQLIQDWITANIIASQSTHRT